MIKPHVNSHFCQTPGNSIDLLLTKTFYTYDTAQTRKTYLKALIRFDSGNSTISNHVRYKPCICYNMHFIICFHHPLKAGKTHGNLIYPNPRVKVYVESPCVARPPGVGWGKQMISSLPVVHRSNKRQVWWVRVTDIKEYISLYQRGKTITISIISQIITTTISSTNKLWMLTCTYLGHRNWQPYII